MKRMLLSAAMVVATVTMAQAQSGFQPENSECIAPANPGGGWDFSCRQVGKVLQDLNLIPGSMQVTNMAGGGGGVAYAEVVNKRNTDDDLIIAASSATTTRLAQKAFPGNTVDQVRWVGTIGADYGIIGVAADSPFNTLPELMDAIKKDPSSVSVAGGSAVAGWDHLKVLLAAKKAGFDDVRKIKYVAFNGGGEAVTQILAGSVQAFSGDLSEAKGFVDSGDLKVLAVLAPERLEGEFAKFPTAKEQGIDAIGANWRGFYAPGGMSDEAFAFWADSLQKLYASPEWKAIMVQNGLASLGLTGDEFEAFVQDSVASIEELWREIAMGQ